MSYKTRNTEPQMLYCLLGPRTQTSTGTEEAKRGPPKRARAPNAGQPDTGYGRQGVWSSGGNDWGRGFSLPIENRYAELGREILNFRNEMRDRRYGRMCYSGLK